MSDEADMVRHLPFPFSDGRFPPELGAVVQRTVLEGHEPARTVSHTEENDWLVGDGVNDPNLPDAAVATHLWHVIQQTPSGTWALGPDRAIPGRLPPRLGRG